MLPDFFLVPVPPKKITENSRDRDVKFCLLPRSSSTTDMTRMMMIKECMKMQIPSAFLLPLGAVSSKIYALFIDPH